MKLIATLLFLLFVVASISGQSVTPTPVASPGQTGESSNLTPEQKERAQLQFQIGTAMMRLKLYGLTGDEKSAGAAKELSDLLTKAVQDSETIRWYSSSILQDYTDSRRGANSAMQVSQVADESGIKFQFLIAAQNQVLIEQNKKIIGLLEVIAKKPSR